MTKKIISVLLIVVSMLSVFVVSSEAATKKAIALTSVHSYGQTGIKVTWIVSKKANNDFVAINGTYAIKYSFNGLSLKANVKAKKNQTKYTYVLNVCLKPVDTSLRCSNRKVSVKISPLVSAKNKTKNPFKDSITKVGYSAAYPPCRDAIYNAKNNTITIRYYPGYYYKLRQQCKVKIVVKNPKGKDYVKTLVLNYNKQQEGAQTLIVKDKFADKNNSCRVFIYEYNTANEIGYEFTTGKANLFYFSKHR